MAKTERKLVDKYSQEQMGDIKGKFGAITGEAESQLPGAKGNVAGTRAEALGAARGLAEGTSNPYAKQLAEGTANPYATGLATTGGISEDEAQAMETAATRGVRSVYDVLGAEAKRKQAITGGYGGAGEISQMARHAGQVSAEAGTDARARIAGLRQQGKVSGAGLITQGQTAGAEMYGRDKVAGAQLLQQQFGLDQNQSNTLMDYILKAQSTGIQLTQQDVAFLAEMSKQKSRFGAVAEGI